jgi:hypothetical protein
MLRSLTLLVVLGALAACGGGGDGDAPETQGGQQQGPPKSGLSLAVSFDGPLRTGHPVTWKLEVENAGPGEVLMFRSGKDGDVALLQGGRVAYRWSADKYFSQAMREQRLGAGERKTFSLEEKALPAAAGDYELVGEVDSQPAPPPARRSVKVEAG